MSVPTRFGPFEITGALGAGGMGEVYRARDTKLGRSVALKFLPAIVSADPHRLARFEREATTLAALNHPNIAQIFGVEESGDTRALVMELVEGEDLSQRIARGAVPIDEALAIARQIAEALEAAHELGIIHRDLKPANVRIRDDGTVKVLDFGLAKALERTSGTAHESPTLTSPAMTVHGAILGTAAYMSPEQARGRPVDKRADIWAFGAVLYEMLTGTRLFEVGSVAETLSLVLTRPPDLTSLPPSLPPAVRELVRRCLEADPRRRLRDIGEARVALENGGGSRVDIAALPSRSMPRRGVVAAVGAIIVLAAAAGWWIGRGARAAESAPWHAFTQLTNQAGEETSPTIAPDGTSIAYASRARGTWDIYVQRIGGRNPVLVAGDESRDESAPAFSPDGLTLAFHESDREGGIFVMGATGESARRLTDFGFHPAWSPDGKHVAFCTEEVADPYTRNAISALWVVDAAGGAPRKIADGDAMQPTWSPHDRRIAFWANDSGQRDLFTVPVNGGARVPVLTDAALDWSPTWSPDGRFLYFASDRGGAMNVWRVGIDEASGRALGVPTPVTSGVHAVADRPSLSKDGAKLAFRSQVRTINPVAIPFDPLTERLGTPRTLIHGTGVLTPTDISRDGRWLVLSSQGDRQDDIFVCTTDGADLRRLTDDVFRDRWPTWSPSGTEVVFYSNRSGRYEIWSIKADGSGLRKISDEPGQNLLFPVLSQSGDRLVTSIGVSKRAWIADPSQPWQPANARELGGLGTDDEWMIPVDWSPDGRRLVGPMMSRAGTINGFGVYEFDGRSGGKLGARNAAGDGYRVSWLPDSRRVILVERAGERIVLIDVDSGRERILLARSPLRFWSNRPPISSDGRTIYLGGLEIQSDVWMATRE